MWISNPPRELPEFYDDPPADLRMLVGQNHIGLAEIRIQKQMGRGKYKKISNIRVQDRPGPGSIPTLDVDDITVNIMREIAAEIEESDDPGRYQILLVMGCPPGQRQKVRAMHIDLNPDDNGARAVKTVDEGDLIEMMQSYIGELHQQNVAQNEALTTVIEPLVRENKEMMRIVTDAQKKIAEVEAMRLEHQLREREMDEDRKFREEKDRRDHERKMALIEQVKKSGALESMVAMFQNYVAKNVVGGQPIETQVTQEQPVKADIPRRAHTSHATRSVNPGPNFNHANNAQAPRQNTHRAENAQPARPTAFIAPISQPPPPAAIPSIVDDDPGQAASIISDFLNHVQQSMDSGSGEVIETKAADLPIDPFEHETQTDVIDDEVSAEAETSNFGEGPLFEAAQLLKFSITENNQWRVVFKTLDDRQAEIFEDIFAAQTDAQISQLVAQLKTTSWANLLKLKAMLDGAQKQFVGTLLQALSS